MRILAVSNDLSFLSELTDVLKKIVPEADVIKETDPLMACKYSFKNEVDFTFADWEMKRMSFSDLTQFIKKERPRAKTYLIDKNAVALDALICDEFDGVIGYPFSLEELTKALKGEETADARQKKQR